MDPTLPQTIDGVLARLDAIIDEARREGRRLGYFAVLYRGVTARVKEGIAAGRFEDPARMERLDVIFANRYLAAYDAFRRGAPCSACWRLAFEAAEAREPLVLQHLLLGMHAHIDLDLGIAAAETAPGAALPALERDFREINALLVEMLGDVQDRLSRVSPWLGLLDRVAGGRDEALARLGLRGTRSGAWLSARRLAALQDADARTLAIDDCDRAATTLGRGILRPPGRLLPAVLRVVRWGERRSPAEVIDVLAAAT